MDIEDDSKVDIETSIFVRNVAEKIAGAIHVHLSGKVRIDKCAFVGAPVPKVFVRLVTEEIQRSKCVYQCNVLQKSQAVTSIPLF